MGIIPNSTIQVYKGIPLKSRYEDTFYFSSPQAQNSYFSNLSAISVLKAQYRIEPTNNAITISLPYSTVYNCNYMRFINNDYENKWFYAFITNVEYVNENASRINYEIDVMQTWLPNQDYTLAECFVEREHSETDNVGDNIVTENLVTGEYVSNESYYLNYTTSTDGIAGMDNAQCIVALIANNSEGQFSTALYDNIVSCATPLIFNTWVEGDLEALASFIDELYTNNMGDRLLSMYMIPIEMIDNNAVDWVNHTIKPGYTGVRRTIHTFEINGETDLNGYIPRNKKCLTYPFNYEVVSTSDGSSFNKRYEFCNKNDSGNLQSEYVICSNVLQPIQSVLRNYHYATDTDKLVLNNLPVCAWTHDTYKTWLENEMPKQLIGMGNSVGSALISSAAQNWLGVASSGISLAAQIGGLLWENEVRSRNNIQTNGTISSAGADYGHRIFGFRFFRYSVTAQYAKTIDDYFTMFGYATKRVKKPNINVRENWTYTKTVNCSIIDDKLPVKDSEKIETIFNNGIRFWNPTAKFCDYSQSNRTV